MTRLRPAPLPTRPRMPSARPLVTRRTFVGQVGRAAFGVVAVGLLPACSAGTADGGSSAAPAGDGAPSPAAGAAASPGAAGSEPAAAAVDWRRVDLDFVSAYVLVRDSEAAVVDTGVAGSEDAIEEALTELDLRWDDVGHVIFTHRHPDHAGSAVAVLQRAAGATAYAGPGDADAINTPGPVTVVEDGDLVFDLRIIATPGHTPGHISVLDEAGGLLVAGDALVGGDDDVLGPDPQFTEDLALAHDSVRRLADLTFGTAVFGHGEPLSHEADAAVARLAGELASASAAPSPAPAPSAPASPAPSPDAT